MFDEEDVPLAAAACDVIAEIVQMEHNIFI
jgi:hypothetical protein